MERMFPYDTMIFLGGKFIPPGRQTLGGAIQTANRFVGMYDDVQVVDHLNCGSRLVMRLPNNLRA